jgi:hypothetical protein
MFIRSLCSLRFAPLSPLAHLLRFAPEEKLRFAPFFGLGLPTFFWASFPPHPKSAKMMSSNPRPPLRYAPGKKEGGFFPHSAEAPLRYAPSLSLRVLTDGGAR